MENSPLAPRNRRRREREPPRRSNADEHEKPSTKAQEKHLNRTPLRYVPDAAGFEALTKPEIKSDMREIEKNATMLPPFDHEAEADDGGLIICSSKPPCPPESNITKKRKRYVTWINHPELIEQDMTKYRAALKLIQNEYQDIVDEELRWTDAFLVGRRHLLAQIQLLDDEIKDLRTQGQQLYSLCIEESGIQSRKRRTMHMRDVLSEMHDHNQELMAQITEHKKLVADAKTIPGLNWMSQSLRCELSIESLGYTSRDAVSTPYGKGTVLAIHDRRSQQAGVVVVVKLDFGIAHLQHEQVHSLGKLTAKAVPVTADQPAMDVAGQRLLSRFSAIEERLRLAEASVGDIENMLPDDDDEEEAGDTSDGLDDEPLAARRAAEQAQAALYLMDGPNHDDAFWLRQLEDRTNRQQTRRKRRTSTTLECHTTLLPRTPYQVPLLLSPVSPFPDRYLGGLYGGDPREMKTANRMHVPSQIVHAENVALDNQHLLANLARAKILLKRLQDAKEDWERQLEESDKTLARTRAVHQALEAESEMLYAQHRRDLAAWQVGKHSGVPVGEADLLLAAQADAQQKSARAVQRGNGRAKRGGRARGSLRNESMSFSQESAASNNAADADSDHEKGMDKTASADNEALAIGALTSLGNAATEEDAEDDVDKKGSKKRVVRRRNR